MRVTLIPNTYQSPLYELPALSDFSVINGENNMDKEIVKQIAYDVIDDYMAKHNKKVAPATAPNLKDKARELLKRCDQKYQKNVLDKLVDND